MVISQYRVFTLRFGWRLPELEMACVRRVSGREQASPVRSRAFYSTGAMSLAWVRTLLSYSARFWLWFAAMKPVAAEGRRRAS